MKAFPRITINPDQMSGRPCIRGIRMPVSRIVEMGAEGMTVAKILANYPGIEEVDIPAALHCAAETLRMGQWPTDENYED